MAGKAASETRLGPVQSAVGALDRGQTGLTRRFLEKKPFMWSTKCQLDLNLTNSMFLLYILYRFVQTKQKLEKKGYKNAKGIGLSQIQYCKAI